jgi:hypothetical protein
VKAAVEREARPWRGQDKIALRVGRVLNRLQGPRVQRGRLRSLKAIDLDLRPIYYYTEARVRAHVFICMLALYLVWHLRKAWAPLCFTDEAPPERGDPVAAATRSEGALAKVSRHTDDDGEPVHSFGTLLGELATLTRNTIVFAGCARIPSWPSRPRSSAGRSTSSACLSRSCSTPSRQNNYRERMRNPCSVGVPCAMALVTSV